MTYCFHLVQKSTGHKRRAVLQQVKWPRGSGDPASSTSPPAAVPETHLRQDSPNAPTMPPDGTLAREPSLTSALAMKSTPGEDMATSS